ncbi:ABC transporter permease subunit [Nonomuraea sp. NPDC050786]|uniref:ABC transporter permease subunit n=1 Tax=Nonomuraea sp. NPDC050786 TaxID=3154840 RepID=UPI0033F38C05
MPGKGGTYTAVTPLWGTVPPANNSFYQAMNKALGATLTMKPADGTNYDTIVTPMAAAKKLPDWIRLPPWWNAAFGTDRLVGSQLADLTPYLAGDKVKKYPNLAAIPTGAWQACVWGDKLYGIPCFSGNFMVPGCIFYRRDILEARGITADQVKSVADFILILRSFYSSTAAELIDAARIDGASDWRILRSVVLPTSRAVTAVIALFYAVGYWNSFFNVMLYMPTESEKWPLQYVLLTYVNRGVAMPGTVNAGFGMAHAQTAPLSLQMAVVVLTLVPLLIVYPFVQKHFRTGLLTGAIKG